MRFSLLKFIFSFRIEGQLLTKTKNKFIYNKCKLIL